MSKLLVGVPTLLGLGVNGKSGAELLTLMSSPLYSGDGEPAAVVVVVFVVVVVVDIVDIVVDIVVVVVVVAIDIVVLLVVKAPLPDEVE